MQLQEFIALQLRNNISKLKLSKTEFEPFT